MFTLTECVEEAEEGEEDGVEIVIARGKCCGSAWLAEEPFDLVATPAERSVVVQGSRRLRTNDTKWSQPSAMPNPS